MTLDMKSSEVSHINRKPEEKIKIQSLKPKRKKWPLILILSLVVLILGVIGFGIFKGIQVFEKIGLKIDSTSLAINNKEPELQKDSTGKYTNFLIVGIDTRPDSGGLNTDTMMVVSYNYDTNNLVMISVPRDLTVDVGNGSYNKINSVYYFGEAKEKGTGLKVLQDKISQVTGIDIQYYAMVNYDAFVDIIDAVGGVDINVEKSFKDVCYPSTKGEKGSYLANCGEYAKSYWKTVSFAEGVQHMDGETALEFSRSRHGTYTDSGADVTDYGRAAHQQQVLLAIKDKVLSTSTLTSPKALMGIISSVADNIKISSFTISDIQAAINLAKKFNDDNGNSYSFVLSPDVAQGEVIANANLYDASGKIIKAYRIAPKLGIEKYSDVNKYVSLLIKEPALYNEDAKIYVYNTGLGAQNAYNKVQDLKAQYPFLNIVYKGALTTQTDGIYVYSHKENEFTQTVTDFSNYLQTTNITKPDTITTNLNNEDVTILLGKEITISNQE